MENQESFVFQVIDKIGLSAQLVAALIIAALTSIVFYLHKVKSGEKFKLLNFFVNITVAIVIAFAADAFMAYWTSNNVDDNLQKVMMVFVGVSANKIMELIETHGNRYLEKKAKKLADKN